MHPFARRRKLSPPGKGKDSWQSRWRQQRSTPFAAATGNPVVCFALVTNRMALVAGDFEKGAEDGTADALALIKTAIKHALPEIH
jgi:hypothetical protein